MPAVPRTPKERKRVKALKRCVARAERIKKDGLQPHDVRCPHCGAPPFVSVKRDFGYCRTYVGGSIRLWNPLPRHRDHKARVEEAKRQKAEILRRGEEARTELGLPPGSD